MITLGLIIYFIKCEIEASVFEQLGFKDCDISLNKVELRYHKIK